MTKTKVRSNRRYSDSLDVLAKVPGELLHDHLRVGDLLAVERDPRALARLRIHGEAVVHLVLDPVDPQPGLDLHRERGEVDAGEAAGELVEDDDVLLALGVPLGARGLEAAAGDEGRGQLETDGGDGHRGGGGDGGSEGAVAQGLSDAVHRPGLVCFPTYLSEAI